MRFCRFWLLAFFVLLSGGATASDLALSALMQKGRHHELIQELQPRVDGGQEVTTFQLLMLGGAYY